MTQNNSVKSYCTAPIWQCHSMRVLYDEKTHRAVLVMEGQKPLSNHVTKTDFLFVVTDLKVKNSSSAQLRHNTRTSPCSPWYRRHHTTFSAPRTRIAWVWNSLLSSDYSCSSSLSSPSYQRWLKPRQRSNSSWLATAVLERQASIYFPIPFNESAWYGSE